MVNIQLIYSTFKKYRCCKVCISKLVRRLYAWRPGDTKCVYVNCRSITMRLAVFCMTITGWQNVMTATALLNAYVICVCLSLSFSRSLSNWLLFTFRLWWEEAEGGDLLPGYRGSLLWPPAHSHFSESSYTVFYHHREGTVCPWYHHNW